MKLKYGNAEIDLDEPPIRCTRSERKDYRREAIELTRSSPFYDGSKAGRRSWMIPAKNWIPEPDDDDYPRARGDRWWHVRFSGDEYGRTTIVFPIWYRRAAVMVVRDHPCGWCESQLLDMIEMMKEDLAEPEDARQFYASCTGW